MPRYFTLSQAQSLLPLLEKEFRQVVHIRRELEGAASDLDAYSQHIAMAGGALVDQRRLLSLRGRRDALATRLKEGIEAIQEHGCQVKDLDMGLLDFPTLLRGQEVLLCWKLGESEIAYWHGTEEGFRGRKPIDDDFLANHAGDPQH
ncbi:MAG: DUF2203 domain-containing protein [Bryobacteraceae bacterium]|nr:DUF2203 domain-containing protein [Bryobacteraceae bacterium]